MATWYAQDSENWTNVDSGGPSAGQGIWNSAIDGSGSWGTPAQYDTCDLNGQNPWWDYSLDGITFVDVGLVQDTTTTGTLTVQSGPVNFTAPLTIADSV